MRPWSRVGATEQSFFISPEEGNLTELAGEGARKLLPRVLPLLDGTRTEEEVLAKFPAAVHTAVTNVIGILEDQGCLLHIPPVGSESAVLSVAAASSGADLVEVDRKLRAAQISVVGETALAERLFDQLRQQGLRADRLAMENLDEAMPQFAIAVGLSTDSTALGHWNRHALAESIPWMQLVPFDGRQWTIGPLFVPHQTCCLECYRTRRAVNLPYVEPDPFVLAGKIHAFADVAIAITAMFAIRWLAVGEPTLPGVAHCLRFDSGLTLTRESVLRLPRCSTCRQAATLVSLNPWHAE